MPSKKYDYIITGTGCAGLSLAMHLIDSGKFQDKKILLVDEEIKDKNDRTWCFWETGTTLFESIVFRQWNHLWFYGEDFYKELSIDPYRYKMIRGIDFYNFCLSAIQQHSNFEFLNGRVTKIFSDQQTGIIVNDEAIFCEYIFNTIVFKKPVLAKNQHWLLQHFKGWKIKTAERTFDSQVATFMDFRVDQQKGTTFCYLLPFSDKEALVEYTLFTPQLLKDEEYDIELKNYIEKVLHINDYEITDIEFGVIPMTNYKFPMQQNNIINIGTAGGQTKGSSGYTFYFIQKHSKAIVDSLIKKGKPFAGKTPSRFHFYDSVLLNILHNNRLPGKEIFSTLFEKNKVKEVLTFLNNESSLVQDIKIISTLPTLPFLKAAIQQKF